MYLDLSAEKQVVRDFQADLDRAEGDELFRVFEQYSAPNFRWRGFHPFNEIDSAEATVESFWMPFRAALSSMQRRNDVFMAGANSITGRGGNWAASMGHFMGLFDKPWLGIPPTRKIAMLRYCEFNKVEEGRIAETALYFDIPHLMAQAGCSPFASQAAAHMVQPGPMTHDGLMYSPQDQTGSEKTLLLIEEMIRNLGQWNSVLSLQDELRQTWAEDMIWWGPEGIGATYTIERYAEQHSGPFRAALSNRSQTQHVARIAEGNYGGFFGWPNFTATPTGDFLGLATKKSPAEFRVIDIYRREREKLAENWVFIDLLHFWKMQGVDILANAVGTRTN